MDWLSLTVLGLIALVIVTTFILYRGGVMRDIPFFNWFELHYTVTVIGVLAIILLAEMGKLESNTITTLFSSLVAYVLGASTGKTKTSASDGNVPANVGANSLGAANPPAAASTASSGAAASTGSGAVINASRATPPANPAGTSPSSQNSGQIPV